MVFASFLHELETENETMQGWFHFYTSLKQRMKLCSGLVSFLHELETKNETVLGVGFIFTRA
jgi:hypothetical protein